VYKVGDQFGNATPGISVSFSDTPNHGTFTPNPATTDSQGKVSASYKLAIKAGFDTLTASVGSLNSPTVQERGLAGAATLVAVLSGSNQTANKNTLLPQQLKVKVTDQYGNVVAGVTVIYNDNNAQGSFSSTTAITNSSGVAAVSYTTPNQSGTVTINATVTGLAPAIFTVHVN
jgi:lysozyme family protein